jgi:hypothetical protein
MKTVGLIVAFVFVICFSVRSQTFEEYQKQQQQQFTPYVKEQQEGMIKLQQEYNDFVKKRNEEFARYLEKEWASYNAFKANKPVEMPKPPAPPKFDPQKESVAPVKIKTISPPVIILPQKEDPKPVLVPVPDKVGRRMIVPFDFFGQQISIKVDPAFLSFALGQVGQNEISRFWRKISESNYGDIILQINVLKEQLNLNDWGVYQLMDQFSARISSSNDNTKTLYTWFLMTVSGYKGRLAFNSENQKLYLLSPASQELFNCQFLKFNNQEYYFLGEKGEGIGSVLTYDEEYMQTSRRINLIVSKPLNFKEKYQARKLKFSSEYPEFEVNVPLNEMAFYAAYPQTDFSVYMGAPLNPSIKEAVMNYFARFTKDRSPTEITAMLLEFTQKAFAYKTDDAQFGIEKWFFPGEVFYYPYCDCEDRAALFSWLVYNIAQLDVVGILFPGHMSTAVLFPKEVPGDFVLSGQKKYVICDGTFIGAPIGMCMPQFVGKPGEIIPMPGRTGSDMLADILWEKVAGLGGYPGDGKCEVMDNQGNIVMTGWFDRPFSLGKTTTVPQGGRDLFVASFTGAGNLNWVQTMGGTGAEYVTGIVKDQTGNLIISGNFSSNIIVAGKSLESRQEGASLFLLSLKPGGTMNWVSPVTFEDLKTRQNIYYQVSLDTDGKILDRQYLPQQDMYWKNMLLLENKTILATGGFSTLPGMIKKTVAVNEATSYDVPAVLKEKNDKLIAGGYDKGAAGLFAAFTMLNEFESKLSGKVVQQTLDKFNPTFKTKSPALYKSFGIVEFLKNADGIITLRTLDNQFMEFDKMKVKSDANMKMVQTPDGDACIEFISGAKVGKAFVWFPLNSITIIKSTGDLIFDYAKDHSKSTLNLNRDVLY